MIRFVKNLIFSPLLIIVMASNDHPQPPAIPSIQAIYDHEQITVYWDKSAEKSIDPLSGYSDFEGYRIYRSTDGGETWGAFWDKIYNYSDDQVGWEPKAQYDLRGIKDSTHCNYSNAYYVNSIEGEKCYSNSIRMSQLAIDSLYTILGKQYLKIDTVFQEINMDGISLRSSFFINDIEKFNNSLTQNTIIVDTIYEYINTIEITPDSLEEIMKLRNLIFEPPNEPCSDNSSDNQHECLCESSALWTGIGCIKWNGSEYIAASATGNTWDRTSFYIPILSGDIINKSIKSNLTDSLDRLIVSIPGIEIDTIFHSITAGKIDSDSINVLIGVGGASIDTIFHSIITGNIDVDSIDVLIGMGEDDLKSEIGGFIDTVFYNISTIGCKYGKLCEFDFTCDTENETNGFSWVCDTTATYAEGGQLGQWIGVTDPTDTTGATGKLRKLHSPTSGSRSYCDSSGNCGLNYSVDSTAQITILKKSDWEVLPFYVNAPVFPAFVDTNGDGILDKSKSIIVYPDWIALPIAVDADADGDLDSSKSVINVPDWEVINNCTSVFNVPDFTVKSSGCYAYGADCAIEPDCWAYGSNSECNDPDLNSNIKIKIPNLKIRSSGSSISVPDWWVSENSNSKIRIPGYNRNEDVSGYHELALWTNIGSDEASNKGLFRSFHDTNILDGIEYTYAVTSYDMGLKTYIVSYIDELFEPYYDKNNDKERGKYEYFIDIDENGKCNDITDNIYIPDTVWSNANPDHYKGINGKGYPSFETPIFYESFTDYNANGKRDGDEPFIDENGNSEWDLRVDPQNVISIVAGYKGSNKVFPGNNSLVKSDLTNIGNGSEYYRIVNIEDVQPKIIRFEVNAKLDSNAYGNLSGSFPTQTPSIYGWEIDSEENISPVNTITITRENIKEELENYTDSDSQSCDGGWRCLCIENWELGNKSKINSDGPNLDYNCRKNLSTFCDSGCENECIEDCNSIIQDMPGVTTDGISQQYIIPDYLIDNFVLAAIDNPNYESYWTDWVYGVQFRFDNGPDEMPARIIIKNINYSDTTLKDILSIDMKYQSLDPADFSRRPGFIYKIEFGSITMAGETAPVNSCKDNNFPLAEDGSQINTYFPFTITNTTLANEVSISHLDKGSEIGEIAFGLAPSGGCDGQCGPPESDGNICYWFDCVPATGFKDCIWQSNEVLKFIDSVYTSNGYGPDALTGLNPDGHTNNSIDDNNPFGAKLFQLRIDINQINYFESFGINHSSLDTFNVSKMYNLDDIVYYEGWLWQVTSDISLSIEPNGWLDDGNGTNISPWKILYPWEEGSHIIVEPYGWFADGDAWTVNYSSLGEIDNNPIDDLDNISVVPNPYIVESDFDPDLGDHYLRFTRLPLQCTIKIYTINGELVKQIFHVSSFDGSEFWDLKNEAGQEVAPGLYIYVVETDDAKKINKFAIIR